MDDMAFLLCKYLILQRKNTTDFKAYVKKKMTPQENIFYNENSILQTKAAILAISAAVRKVYETIINTPRQHWADKGSGNCWYLINTTFKTEVTP
ncbi:MAG: hypothetical protein KJ717_11440 [Proteobacteria bacterium]|nr:hypothetical protein [Pseudomonadota bacterium]